MSGANVKLALPKSNQQSEKQASPLPQISFPTPKSEPNLQSSYVFPKDTNERASPGTKEGSGTAVSEIGYYTFTIT
jgi:hypothetical protein